MGDQIIEAVEPFETFYRNHYREVLAVVIALTRDHAGAEDVTQDAFLKAQRRWTVVSGYGHRQAWVKRVALNLATSRYRRLAAEGRAFVRIGPLADAGEPTSPGEEVWRAVRALPRLQAQCTALFYVDDLSIAQIGALLGVADGTVKASLARARETLAEHLGGAHER